MIVVCCLSLFVVKCWLIDVLVFVVVVWCWCLMSAVRCSLFAVCWLLVVVLLSVVCCSSRVVRCLLCVDCGRVLFAGWCALFAVC